MESVRKEDVVRVAVVGDIHGHWSSKDSAAVTQLDADMLVFVGDMNNEDVPLVKEIASCPYPKAVMLGNHDAWTCLTSNRRLHKWRKGGYDASKGHFDPAAKVREQIAALGKCHLAYNHLRPVPSKPFTIVGARPFSKGGQDWKLVRSFYSHLFGVETVEQSRQRIVEAVRSAPEEDALLLVGHNGPLGMGGQAHDPAGVDFRGPEGADDFGDEDLQMALADLHRLGKHVPAVVFGHMHDQLQMGGTRRMIHRDSDSGSLYINTARVPRVRPLHGKGSTPGPGSCTVHNFTVLEYHGSHVAKVCNVWVRVSASSSGSDWDCRLHSEEELVRYDEAGVPQLLDEFEGVWKVAAGV